MRKRNIAIIVIALMQSPATLARPVSYPGGWTVMQMHNRANTSVHLHYSPSARHSVGVRGFHIRDKNAFAGALQVNVLLKRVNNRESQANLYFKGGGGPRGIMMTFPLRVFRDWLRTGKPEGCLSATKTGLAQSAGGKTLSGSPRGPDWRLMSPILALFTHG